MIVTDGEENSSREFTRDQIRTMVEHQQSAFKWQFTFLATKQDAFAAGGSMGIAQDGIAAFSPDKMRGTYAAAAKKMSRMRKAAGEGAVVDNKFTEEERGDML
jgi:hypothetical protein